MCLGQCRCHCMFIGCTTGSFVSLLFLHRWPFLRFTIRTYIIVPSLQCSKHHDINLYLPGHIIHILQFSVMVSKPDLNYLRICVCIPALALRHADYTLAMLLEHIVQDVKILTSRMRQICKLVGVFRVSVLAQRTE